PHAGGPLGEGQLDGCTLTCPWHGWSYDLETGKSLVSDNVFLVGHPVEVVDGMVTLIRS
ncbi:MAG: Rieske 2Fe-2S domain-containing protein, partial [Myxococcota bacterium]